MYPQYRNTKYWEYRQYTQSVLAVTLLAVHTPEIPPVLQVLELSAAKVIFVPTFTRGAIWECIVPNDRPENCRHVAQTVELYFEVYWAY